MAFGGKIYNGVKTFAREKAANKIAVGNVAAHKCKIRITERPSKRGEVTRICEFIETYYAAIGVIFEHVMNKIAADKPRAARHQNFHAVPP